MFAHEFSMDRVATAAEVPRHARCWRVGVEVPAAGRLLRLTPGRPPMEGRASARQWFNVLGPVPSCGEGFSLRPLRLFSAFSGF